MNATQHHVVLGATGVVGRETVSALTAANVAVTAVSRSGSPVGGAGARAADLRDGGAVAGVLDGASVAYLTVGLPYTLKAWRADWPTVVRNTIDGCVASGAHLVYFDNVYAYGRADQPMTEATPIRPASRKGELRASLLEMLDEAARERGLVVTVGRSADFYGPGASTSVFNTFALDSIRAGKRPTWLFDAGLPHSMTYTPDIGRALAVLATDPRARGRVWHLPTAAALTGAEYLRLAGAHKVGVMSATTMRIGGLFTSAAREAMEMAYQNTGPYLFDSSAFEREFGVRPTPYAEGISATLAHGSSAAVAR